MIYLLLICDGEVDKQGTKCLAKQELPFEEFHEAISRAQDMGWSFLTKFQHRNLLCPSCTTLPLENKP